MAGLRGCLAEVLLTPLLLAVLIQPPEKLAQTCSDLATLCNKLINSGFTLFPQLHCHLPEITGSQPSLLRPVPPWHGNYFYFLFERQYISQHIQTVLKELRQYSVVHVATFPHRI